MYICIYIYIYNVYVEARPVPQQPRAHGVQGEKRRFKRPACGPLGTCKLIMRGPLNRGPLTIPMRLQITSKGLSLSLSIYIYIYIYVYACSYIYI